MKTNNRRRGRFKPRQRNARSRQSTKPEYGHPKLLAACEKLLEDWDNRNLTAAVQGIAVALAEVKNP